MVDQINNNSRKVKEVPERETKRQRASPQSTASIRILPKRKCVVDSRHTRVSIAPIEFQQKPKKRSKSTKKSRR